MEESRAAADAALDKSTVNVKLPRWLKQLAASIGEITGEDIGEVIERHAADSLAREYRERTAAMTSALRDEAPVLSNSLDAESGK